jgi:type III pantothenate kinase
MLLAVDIGNTNIAVGIFRQGELVEHWKIRSDPEKTCDEYKVILRGLLRASLLEETQIQGAILSSVVPPLTPVFQDLCRGMLKVKPLTVGPGLKTGLPILYENPLEVGADRVVTAVAALERFGGPCIVVDFGTATTFDAISARGEYLGGAIAPGVRISAEALYTKASKLPRIEIARPERAIGRTTVTSMQSGLYYGYIGLVSSLIERVLDELGDEARVVATGGFASLVHREIPAIDHYEPDLVLEGLRILFERNRKS